ncbi:hypothetical protein A3B87_01070 [Candidatus Kuenenbacteria bacterium RIFCSPHIGHO2_02_FULL_39_13]|uniref:Glycosyl transferase family 1 domain-containing protein n=1 Tax=Candidatus Kuenenbacteria bacterium RIFCSPHIGHO2_02_FULL_39_13 TaxID=1798561 RepID=A0A1F6FMS3_9BACT|nr:MAG: hypothetical protein A3B87_01070 [Candidatus Kuenenbacteria bacterium RIFCSPHIGHO2_02_FULL_39_13]
MENKEFKLVITSLVPKTLEHIGKSGGLVRLLEIIGRMSRDYKVKIMLITADKDYARYFAENQIEADIKFIKSNLKFRTLWGLGIKSLLIILKFIFFYPKEFLAVGQRNIFYCASDLFWETLPAYFCRSWYKNIRWVQEIYHIYPHWKKRKGSFIFNFFGYHLQQFSFFLIKRKADLIFSLSDLLKEDLINSGFSKEKIAVSYNGIDCGYFEKLPAADTCYEGIFLGRLNYSKGIFDLIEIWKKVCAAIPQAKLVIIGGGDEKIKEDLKEKITALNMKNNIEVLGYLENKKAYALLKSSKVFLFPSHEEGWGIVINEALACGLPVVSWDLLVYKSIFENYVIQIKENDIEKFSNEVIKLLKNKELRNQIGLAGKEFIKKYSWDNVAENEYQMIKNL